MIYAGTDEFTDCNYSLVNKTLADKSHPYHFNEKLIFEVIGRLYKKG